MCDTVTQLSIYSVDRVKLTAMSVNFYFHQWHYRFDNNADIFSRFLKSTIILCTLCTTLKTLNEILNIKYNLWNMYFEKYTQKIDIWCVAWWREIFNLFFYCWLKSIYYWLNYDIIHLVDKLLINANWYPFGIFRDSISFLFSSIHIIFYI